MKIKISRGMAAKAVRIENNTIKKKLVYKKEVFFLYICIFFFAQKKFIGKREKFLN